MRKTALFALLFTFLSSSQLLAQDYGSNRHSKSKSKSSSGAPKYGMGISSNSHLLRTSESALSFIYLMDAASLLHFNFVMTSSDPGEYGLSGAYKKSIVGNNARGLHFGGAFGFGSYSTGGGNNADDETFMRLSFLAGVHFAVAKRVLISADGGATFADDGGDTDSQFYIGGQSAVWGASVVYLF